MAGVEDDKNRYRMNNHYYWIHRSRDGFRKEIAVLREVVVGRLLPTFALIDQESEAKVEAAWERLNATADDKSDEADAAEAAEQAGVAHYLALVDAKQGLLNLFAVALHHLVEQQQITVLRQELVLRDETVSLAMLSVTEFVKRLAAAGIKVAESTSWLEIEELRNVANAAKHAEGRSAQWLWSNRPEIFTASSLRGDAPLFQGPSRWLFQPMTGQDLYVTTDDLERYFRAANKFWQEFEDALASKAQPDRI